MASIEESLAAAEACLEAGQPKEALQHCKAALKSDKRSVEAFVLIGRAAQAIQEHGQAELAYRKALEVAPGSLAAWAGLSRLYAATGNTAGAVESNEKLLSLLPEEDPSHAQHEVWLADAYNRSGQYADAARQYRQLLARAAHHPDVLPDGLRRVDLLCRLADIQLKLDEARAAEEVEARITAAGGEAAGQGLRHATSNVQLEVLSEQAISDEAAAACGAGGAGDAGSCAQTLLELCSAAPPAERYVRYHEEWLKRCLLKIFSAPPRSVERQHFRLAALRECHTCMWKAGTSALPFEAAVWLLEEEEEIKGGHVPVGGQVVGSSCAVAGGVQEGAEGHLGGGQQAVLYAFENFARRMVHQFPANPTARVCLGLMLRRRACHDGSRPVPQGLRRQIEALLRSAMEDESACDCGTGWKALAELQYENRHYPQAYETALRGLRWLHNRRERGHEALTHVALSLRLVMAKALRRMGRLDEAETHFKVLAGWVTEGEAAFGEMSGSAPVSIHQQALRGIAQVALERGDRPAAMAQYERILGKAALGRGPAEHWAHADYGWLLFQEGDLQGARQQLEDALRVATSTGCMVTDSQLAEHHYRLGEVYWKMRGRYRTEKQFAYTQFFDAASVEGHAQAPAFAALGRYFQEVEGKPEQAMRCYKRALALDPTVATAGDQLCAMLVASGKPDTALTLCKEIAARAPQARWAHRRSGYLLAAAERFEEGVAAFQSALKTDVRDAPAWEGLASCYQNLGRFTASLKAYTRALELRPTRAYARMQCGAIHMALGSFAEATAQYEAALQIAPSHPAALLGAAESLAAAAGVHTRTGALGTAADELARAAAYTLRCTLKHGTLQAAWKLLGDVLVLHHAVTPAPQHPTIPGEAAAAGGAGSRQDDGAFVEGQVEAWRRRVEATRQGRRAYAKALHLDPAQPGAWRDAAFSLHHECQLLRTHPAVAARAQLPSLTGLVAGAERAVRAALRLDGASAEGWAALGAVAAEPAVREYALCRALQLDPKCVPAWVALARLYAEHGEGGPAAAALQHARSHEPAVPAIWEAMADVAALSPTGSRECADYQEHAHGLGAGPTGLLGFAESAVRAGRALDGSVYAAARKAAHAQPLNPAAQNVLGLVSEARGDYATAVASYQRALRLVVAAARDPDAALHHPPAANTGAGAGAAAALQTAVQLNLARALAGADCGAAAAQLYEELEVTAELYDQPHAWLAYGAAQHAAGNSSGAELALQSAAEPGTPASVLAAAVCAVMQLHCQAGRPQHALAHLEQQLPTLHEARVPHQVMEGLWATAAAGAAAARDAALLQQAIGAAKAWAMEADDDSPAFQATLLGLQAAANLAAQQAGSAAAQYSRAAHLCPWNAAPRLGLAACVLARTERGGDRRGAEAALRLLDSPAVAAAVAGMDARRREARAAPAGKPAPEAAAEAGTLAALAAQRITPQQLRQRLSAAARCVHESPTNAQLWRLAAVTAKKAAAMDDGGDGGASVRAWRWCRAAEGALTAAVAAH